MRKQDSQFNYACRFVNSVPVGNTFTSKEYIKAIGHKENLTNWKRYNGNYHYICHQYKGYLKSAGFLENVKRGTWKVIRHIPEWFDFGHLSILLCYYKWDKENRCNILTYKGMNRTDIIAQLDHDAHHPNGVQPNKKVENKLPKLYSRNREVYKKFLEYVASSGKTFFPTQNELYIALERIKFPFLVSRPNYGKVPCYSPVNYDPIINHLMNDGVLTFDGYSNNRKEFTVYLPTVQYGDTVTTKPVEKIITENKNYIQTANKIDNSVGLREVSNSMTQPIPTETKKTLHSPETQELSKNIALLESAFNLVGSCTTPDRFMQARLYSIQVLIQDITSAFDEKINFLTNN